MKNKTFHLAAFAFSFFIAGVAEDAAAMALSSRGMGQVLEFPYYTVNGNQQTVLTLVNDTGAVKALKVRFREAYDGRPAASFNVYLSPFDVWTGAVFLDNTNVVIGTRDNSCTVPKFDASQDIPLIAFQTASFTGANTDGGPTDTARLEEGHFDVFEMGEVISDAHGLQTATYFSTNSTVPNDCDTLVAAWNANGVWATNASTDLGPPKGGLFGSSAVVNVASGTYYAIAPSVIDGFSSAVQHTVPASAAPDLNTPSAGSDGKFAASVDVNSQVITTKFTFPEDAVSALFMASKSLNEYVAKPGVGEQTDWVTTFPTKRFYVDPTVTSSNGTAIPPFERVFGEAPADASQTYVAGSCVNYAMSVFNREELTLTPDSCTFDPCPLHMTFCHETSVIALASSGSALHSALEENITADKIQAVDLLGEGYIEFDVGASVFDHTLTSDDGVVFSGLPMTGFVAENFVNANVTPNVLANYSASIPHRSLLTCTRPGGESTVCP